MEQDVRPVDPTPLTLTDRVLMALTNEHEIIRDIVKDMRDKLQTLTNFTTQEKIPIPSDEKEPVTMDDKIGRAFLMLKNDIDDLVAIANNLKKI